MLRTVSLVFAVAFCLVGCRDALVDVPSDPGVQPPSSDPSGQNEIYLKGPAELRVGDTRNYRAEPLPDVAEYRWSLAAGGTGAVTGVSDDPLLRLYDITGVEEGQVRLSVRAFNDDDLLLGQGSLVVTVLR